MRNIPFKFRGICEETQKAVYGSDISQDANGGIHIGDYHWDGTMVRVIPDSVGQLVGYDDNGYEIYNGNPAWWNAEVHATAE